MDIVLALVSALAFGLSVVLIRKRLDESNPFSVTLVVAVTGNVIFWPLALLFTNLATISLKGILFFAIAGMLAPGITMLLYFKGMESVGVSVSASIFATYPVYSSIFAVLFLGEVLAPENWIGLMCIVVGVVTIEKSLGKAGSEPRPASRKGLVLPLLASLTNASSFIVRKHGLTIYNEPLIGVAIGCSSSFILCLPLSISYAEPGSTFSGKDFRLFWKAGVCMSVGWVSTYYALCHGNVSIITSLIQTQPLFVLLFAYLHVKELEHLSFKLVMNALLIVIGVMLLHIN